MGQECVNQPYCIPYLPCFQPNKGKTRKLRDALDALYSYLDGQRADTKAEVIILLNLNFIRSMPLIIVVLHTAAMLVFFFFFFFWNFMHSTCFSWISDSRGLELVTGGRIVSS